jgi:AcrR family transcriptional regulator
MTPNPKLRKASAEERIMATAAGLFATFGYNGVSTRDIASGAGVNEVTIYRHHPRKRDLYMAVLEAELQQVILRGDLLARVAEASDGKMALARTFELIAATLTHRPELLRLIQFSALELGEDINPLGHCPLPGAMEREWRAARHERQGCRSGADLNRGELRLPSPGVSEREIRPGGGFQRIYRFLQHFDGQSRVFLQHSSDSSRRAHYGIGEELQCLWAVHGMQEAAAARALAKAVFHTGFSPAICLRRE